MAFDPDKYLSEKSTPQTFDPDAYLAEKQGPGLASRIGSAALGAAKYVGEKIQRYGAAPLRAAAMEEVQNGLAGKPISAFASQFGENPETAPTGAEIARAAGVTGMGTLPYAGKGGEPLPIPREEITGAVLEAGLDPLVLAPEAKLLATGGRGAEAATKAAELSTKLATKGAEITTGIPKKAIEIYAKRGDEVKNLLSKTGGELPVAADEMKQSVLDSIAKTKKGLSDAITSDLASNPSVVDVNPIIEKLQTAKSKLNLHYNAGDASQIQEMIDAIQNTAQNDQMDLNKLFDTKNFLQTRSNGSFVKNGELFTSGDKAQKAANEARKLTADILHETSPEIAHADSVYSDLHDLDNKMSTSLLGQGKPENVFASAGGGKGNIHQVNLRKIGEVTGTNPIEDAQLLYASKAFKDPNVRTVVLRALLDARSGAASKLSGLPSIPEGSTATIDKLIQLLGSGEAVRAPAEGNAMQRRMQNSR